jgi:hypothetical protein
MSTLAWTCEAVAESTSAKLVAVEEIRRMRGGTQSHLMRCSDCNCYVVKFPNNPQGIDILSNELLGGRIAQLLGLSVAPGAIVYIDPELVLLSEEMYMERNLQRDPCQAGLCFGSRYATDPSYGTAWDFLPDKLVVGVENLGDFLGMLVFDLWTRNSDGRQAIFFRAEPEHPYRVQMIDQGFCFRGYLEQFAPLRSTYDRWRVYENVRSIDAFEPWLTRVEEIDEVALAAIAEGIPICWYDHDALRILLDRLYAQRTKVRDLLFSLRNLARSPFPNWVAISG